MNTHLNMEELAIYSEHLQKGTLHECPIHIKSHIENCNQCAAEAAELSFIIEEVQARVQTETRGGKLLHLRFLLLAAAAGILLFVGLWFLIIPADNTLQVAYIDKNIFQDTDSSGTTTTHEDLPDTIRTEETGESDKNLPGDNQSENRLADARFKTHPQTEMLAENFTGSMRSKGFEIHTPHTLKHKLSAPLVLKWSKSDNAVLTIELLDNEANILNEYECTDDSLIVEDIVSVGLYYWKVINEDFDLLFCGKIEVRK